MCTVLFVFKKIWNKYSKMLTFVKSGWWIYRCLANFYFCIFLYVWNIWPFLKKEEKTHKDKRQHDVFRLQVSQNVWYWFYLKCLLIGLLQLLRYLNNLNWSLAYLVTSWHCKLKMFQRHLLNFYYHIWFSLVHFSERYNCPFYYSIQKSGNYPRISPLPPKFLYSSHWFHLQTHVFSPALLSLAYLGHILSPGHPNSIPTVSDLALPRPTPSIKQ